MIRRFTVLLVALVTLAAAAIAANAPSAEGALPAGLDRHALPVTIQDNPLGRPIPAGFTGLSLEFSAVPAYAGTNPEAVNPVLEQLIRNLDPGQSPVLRIGGDSTDRTWWPVAGLARPGGVRYTLTPNWMSITRSLAQALHARLIVGVNMEANNRRLAAAEAGAFLAGIGRASIRALELGNEPELYGSFPWYQASPGHGVRGRKPGYGPADYTREVTRLAPSLPNVPLAGPASGGRKWMTDVAKFVAAEPRLGLVTLHRYATRGCFVSVRSPQYHTIGNLLSSTATRGLAQSIAPYVRLRNGHTHPTRVDELGSVNCGGVHGVSDTFASALWALDTLFQLARVGVSGVNFHTFPNAAYEPFSFSRASGTWQASVKPIYYGMLMFAQAVGPGSQLLNGSGSAGTGVDVFALRTPRQPLRVVLINYRTSGARTIAVRVPVKAATVTLEWLRAPSVTSTTGVTIGGQSFGAETSTGTLPAAPTQQPVSPTHGHYAVTVPAASAAILTIRPA